VARLREQVDGLAELSGRTFAALDNNENIRDIGRVTVVECLLGLLSRKRTLKQNDADVSRRDFLKKRTVAGVGASALAGLPRQMWKLG